MPKPIKFILSALIFVIITAAGFGLGKLISIPFEGSTIRIGFIPLGNGTGGTIILGAITIIGFTCACIAAKSFYDNH